MNTTDTQVDDTTSNTLTEMKIQDVIMNQDMQQMTQNQPSPASTLALNPGNEKNSNMELEMDAKNADHLHSSNVRVLEQISQGKQGSQPDLSGQTGQALQYQFINATHQHQQYSQLHQNQQFHMMHQNQHSQHSQQIQQNQNFQDQQNQNLQEFSMATHSNMQSSTGYSNAPGQFMSPIYPGGTLPAFNLDPNVQLQQQHQNSVSQPQGINVMNNQASTNIGAPSIPAYGNQQLQFSANSNLNNHMLPNLMINNSNSLSNMNSNVANNMNSDMNNSMISTELNNNDSVQMQNIPISNFTTRNGARQDISLEDGKVAKRPRQSFEALPYKIVISIFSYIEQIISVDYQHTLHVTTLPSTKRWDPRGKDWMIFDLRRRMSNESRTDPWIATRQDILIFTLYGKFRNDDEKVPRLLWPSLQFACPYPDAQYREQMNNATPGFSCTEYIPWGQVANLRLSGFFTPYSLKYLKFANTIEYLAIEAESIDTPYFQVTNKFVMLLPKQLQYLDLSYVNIDEDAVRSIFERLQHLKVVGLNGISGGLHRVSTARLINQASDLVQLELRQNGIQDDFAMELFKNCRLTFLSLSQNKITPNGWHYIKYNTSLTTLQYYESTIDNQFLECLEQHPHIKDIHMEACVGFTDEGLQKFLCTSSRLESISLARCKLSSIALSGISNNASLKSLYLDFNTNLRVDTFRELSNMQNLRDLSVVGCQITDEHVEALLLGNKSLQNLFLSNNEKIGWGTINAIIQSNCVRYLIVAMCPSLTDEMISKLIQRSGSVSQLILDSNKQLTDAALLKIEESKSITSLSVLSTKISEAIFNKIVYECPRILSYNSASGEFFRPEI